MKRVLLILFLCPCICLMSKAQSGISSLPFSKDVLQVLKPLILREADQAMKMKPITVTAFQSSRSAGGRHDFFSEGDYWWPNPASPDSPYIQKDGMTNPDNFTEHRRAMIRFSRLMGALASAYRLTGKEGYAKQAFIHARAWLKDTATLMHPHLRFAQAIKGRYTGRGIGIIDMIQFMEVSRALQVLEKSRHAKDADYRVFRQWFADYLGWVTSHPYGLDESRALNNHGTCWTMQVAAFASFTGNDSLLDVCRKRYRELHVPGQMAIDGSFPKELARTKPYGYSLFNLDAMVMLCQILSDNSQDLWKDMMSDGRGIRKAIAFMFPYVRDKSKWPFRQDVMYWEDWPVAHPFLLFGAVAYQDRELFNRWLSLPHDPQTEEIIRNLPVRHPLIWFN